MQQARVDTALRTLADEASQGLPRGWIKMMKACVQKLVPHFNTNRMVRDYLELVYKTGGNTRMAHVDPMGVAAPDPRFNRTGDPD